MNIKILSFTKNGSKLSQKLLEVLPDGTEYSDGQGKSGFGGEWTKRHFKQDNALIYVGALGIAVRLITPYVQDKTKDPAVIVIDERGNFVIPLLSGHIGGANELALGIAEKIDALPVITTATDVNGTFAVDVFAKKNNLSIDNMKKAKEFSAKLLESIHQEGKDINDKDENSNMPDAVISPFVTKGNELHLIPKSVVVGMGCRKDKEYDKLNSFLLSTLDDLKIDKRAIFSINSIDKKSDEKGLIELADSLGVPFITYDEDTLRKLPGDFTSSEFVKNTVGVDNVCERAVVAAGASRILLKKTTNDGMSISVGIL